MTAGGALIGGWEIGVTMDEIPFAVDAAIDVRHASRWEHQLLSNASQRCRTGKSPLNPAPARTCVLERENME